MARALCLLALWALALTGCNSKPPPEPQPRETNAMAPKVRFAIRMIDGGNFADLPKEYDDPRFAEVVRTAKLGPIVIDEADVERFAESPVGFVLTEEASRRIARDLQSRELRIEDKPFVVTLGEERLLGGVGLFVGSARAVAIPVIYVDDRSPRLVLWLQPRHVGWYDKGAQTPELATRVTPKQLLDHFRELGKTVVLPGAAAAPASFDAATAALAEAEGLEARGDFAGAVDAAGRALAALGGDYVAPGAVDDTAPKLGAAAVARDAGDAKRAAAATLGILRARIALYRERHTEAPRDPRALALALELEPSAVLGKPMRAVVTLENRGTVPVLVNARLAVNADHVPAAHRELTFLVNGPNNTGHGFISKVRIGAPTAADLVVLAPGEKRTAEVDIVRDHWLTEPGRYTVRAYYESAPVADAEGHPVWAGRLESNESSFELTR